MSQNNSIDSTPILHSQLPMQNNQLKTDLVDYRFKQNQISH